MGISSYLIYKTPNFDFSKFSSNNREIIYIKKPNKGDKKEEYIPCLFIIENSLSPNYLIYFHGNSEHIFDNKLFGIQFAIEFHINIIMVEYKGYSIYKGEPDSATVLEDSLIVYDFIKENFNSNEQKIIVGGRSLGTSPAIYLASKRPVDALITISAFESIQNVGTGFYANILLSSVIFTSINYISDVKCPSLFIHGEKDNIISYTQSEKLYKTCKTAEDKKYFIKRPQMNHNKVVFLNDIVAPVKDFFNKINIISQAKNTINIQDQKFLKLFEIPDYIQQFIDAKYFRISDFKKLANVEIPCTVDTLIIALTDEIFMYSSENKLFIYRNGQEFKKIEETEGNIIYLYKVSDNKFLYLTDKSYLKVYTIDNNNCNLVGTHLLNKPRKIIASEKDDIYYSLGADLSRFKMNDNEKEIKDSKIFFTIKGYYINNFSDILEFKDNVILASEEMKILSLIDFENKKIKIIPNISPKDKNSLYKLNQEEFMVVEKTKILIFISKNSKDSKDIECIRGIYLGSFHLLNVINEEKILITESGRRHIIIQKNIIQNKKTNELRISTNPDRIEEIILMKNKKYGIIKYTNINTGLLHMKKNKNYKIEIWGVNKMLGKKCIIF